MFRGVDFVVERIGERVVVIIFGDVNVIKVVFEIDMFGNNCYFVLSKGIGFVGIDCSCIVYDFIWLNKLYEVVVF